MEAWGWGSEAEGSFFPGPIELPLLVLLDDATKAYCCSGGCTSATSCVILVRIQKERVNITWHSTPPSHSPHLISGVGCLPSSRGDVEEEVTRYKGTAYTADPTTQICTAREFDIKQYLYRVIVQP